MRLQSVIVTSLAILINSIAEGAWPWETPKLPSIPIPNPIDELDFIKPYKLLYSELESFFSAKNILSQLQDLVGNMDGVKQVEGFINDGGLAKLGKMMEDDVLNEIVKFMDDQIVEQTTKLTNEVADSLIGKYGTMKDIYEQQMEPTFRDIESKISDFSFESLFQELAGLIPEGLVKFYENPDQVIVGYVENELLNLNKSVTSAPPKDIVEKFENLANDQELQVNVKKFVTDNGLVKAGTQLFDSANQTFHAVKEGFDRPDAVLEKIVNQIKNVIESTVFRKIMDSWNRLQPYEKVMNMVEKVNLVERYDNLTSDEGLVELAKEVFGGNASQTIIDLATNTKLHDQIVKLVTTDTMLKNIETLVTENILHQLEETITNSKTVKNAIRILEDPEETLITLFDKLEGMVVETDTDDELRKVRSVRFPIHKVLAAIGVNELSQLKDIVAIVQQVIDIEGFKEEALYYLRHIAAVQKMIDLFNKGKSIIEKLLNSKDLLKNMIDLASKHLPIKMISKKFTGVKKMYDRVMGSIDYLKEKKNEIISNVESAKEVVNIATSPDLRNMMKNAKSLADNFDVINDLNGVIANKAPFEKLANVGKGLQKKLESFTGDVMKNIDKLRNNNLIPALAQAQKKMNGISDFATWMIKGGPKTLLDNVDIIKSVGKMSSDSSMIEGVLSLADNIGIAQKVAKLSNKFDKIRSMAEALTNGPGLKKMAELINDPTKVEQMAGMLIDPQLIKGAINLITDPDIIDTAIKTVVDPDLIKKAVNFLCADDIVAEAENVWDNKIVAPLEKMLDSLDPLGDAIDRFTSREEIAKVLESMKPELLKEFEKFINDSRYVQIALTMIQYVPTLNHLPQVLDNVDIVSNMYELVTNKELPEGANVADTIIEYAKEAVVEKIEEEMEEKEHDE